MYLTKFKNNQILYNKISHRFIMKTKLLAGQKIHIKTVSLFQMFLRVVRNESVFSLLPPNEGSQGPML